MIHSDGVSVRWLSIGFGDQEPPGGDSSAAVVGGVACELRFRVRDWQTNRTQGECPRRQRERSLAHEWGRSTVFMAFRPVIPVDVEAGPGATHDHEAGPGSARRPATPG